jgi:transcriptional regulator with XRE-family HTH domain
MAKQTTLGGAIKRLRAASGMTQKEFAEVLSISSTYLSNLEADRREPSIQLLRKMASSLSVPVGLFLAVALSTDLPETPEASSYQPLISKLIELAAVSQLRLGLAE